MSPEAFHRSSAPWHRPLVDRGFIVDGRRYYGHGLSLVMQGRWFAFCEEICESSDRSAMDGLERPGLWKIVQNGALRRVFEIPSWTIASNQTDESPDAAGPVAFDGVLAWALETRRNRVPAEWRPPSADLVQSWLDGAPLTVRPKGHVRQGDLILDRHRWALRIEIVPCIPSALPQARWTALEELAAEAQSLWAMVRVGVKKGGDAATLVAEVDLTGAPHSELLFSAAWSALSGAANALLETAVALSDHGLVITSLAHGGDHNTNRQ